MASSSTSPAGGSLGVKPSNQVDVAEIDADRDSAPSTHAGLQDRDEPGPPRKSSWWRSVVGLVWDSVEGDARNRRYVQKLDTFLFSYICLGYFIKYLDQGNYSNAYVSGMKQDVRSLSSLSALSSTLP